MKMRVRLLLFILCAAAAAWTAAGAENAAPAPAGSRAHPAGEAAAEPELKARPLRMWTPFQVGFLPYFPSAQMTSNVYGIKSGWPMVCGVGRVFGLEASWLYSGTEEMHGIQASWVACADRRMDGIQASFAVCVNEEQLNGLQATLGFAMAGDFYGLQASSLNLSGDAVGFQAAAVANVTGDITGFQASVISNVSKKLTGFQTSLVNVVKESCGWQFGLINVSKKGGFQTGLINYIEDAFLPFFPVLNFSF